VKGRPTKGTLTKEILEERQGVNLGFFYLLPKGETGLLTHGIKCKVTVKAGIINVWDGHQWRPYSDFEPSVNVDNAIDNCETWNGSIP
jgi:hypothetical protein